MNYKFDLHWKRPFDVHYYPIGNLLFVSTGYIVRRNKYKIKSSTIWKFYDYIARIDITPSFPFKCTNNIMNLYFQINKTRNWYIKRDIGLKD